MRHSRHPVAAGANGSNGNTNDDTVPSAALTGASRAFIQHLPPQDLARYIDGHSPRPPQKPRHLSSDAPHGSLGRHGSMSSSRSPPVSKQLPSRSNSSHSNIAASLAAARASPAASSASPPNARGRGLGRPGLHVSTRSSPLPPPAPADRLDESPIAPTNSLVKLFEQKRASKQQPQKVSAVLSPPPSTHRPTPLRASKANDSTLPPIYPPNAEQLVHNRLAAKGLLRDSKPHDEASDSDANESLDSFVSAEETRSPVISPVKPEKPAVPRRRRDERTASSSTAPQDNRKPDIQLHPPNRSASEITPIDMQKPPGSRASSSHATVQSHQSIAAAFNQMHPRRITPLTTGDSLADAIVASSLASSRAVSPHRSLPHTATRHKAGSLSRSFFSRTPSPPRKGMRHTMRKWSSSSSEEDEDPFAKHKKKKFLRKHPNKHHEGDRKRWRDAITARERKRYEGLWAANKGLHTHFTPEEEVYMEQHPHGKDTERLQELVGEQISGVVARDIWSRSRLPVDQLEQVWDLVDSQRNCRLTREEFVVGLWLIDQRLKGRKLPVKVTDSVWNSVRFLEGIKLRKK